MKLLTLITIIYSIILPEIFAESNIESKPDAYSLEVQNLFHKYTTEVLLELVLDETKDILDPDPIRSSKKTSKKIIDLYSKMPTNYSSRKFWEIAARAVIKASLDRDYLSLYFPDKNKFDLVDSQNLLVNGFLETKNSSNNSDIISLYSYVIYTGYNLHELQFFINRWKYFPKREAAKNWLGSLRSILRDKSRSDQSFLVNHPFFSEIISEMKWIEQKNQWPKYVPNLVWTKGLMKWNPRPPDFQKSNKDQTRIRKKWNKYQALTVWELYERYHTLIDKEVLVLCPRNSILRENTIKTILSNDLSIYFNFETASLNFLKDAVDEFSYTTENIYIKGIVDRSSFENSLNLNNCWLVSID